MQREWLPSRIMYILAFYWEKVEAMKIKKREQPLKAFGERQQKEIEYNSKSFEKKTFKISDNELKNFFSHGGCITENKWMFDVIFINDHMSSSQSFTHLLSLLNWTPSVICSIIEINEILMEQECFIQSANLKSVSRLVMKLSGISCHLIEFVVT